MNDTSPHIVARFGVWLPYASLALTLAALGLGAPARLARSIHRSSAGYAPERSETTMHYEPVMFPIAAAR